MAAGYPDEYRKTDSYFPLFNFLRLFPQLPDGLNACGQPELASQLDPRTGLMEIRPLRTQQTELTRVGCELRTLIGRLLTLGDFHRLTATFGKVCQQSFQPFSRKIIPPRMGEHGLTARMMNDINSLFYCTPLWRNVTGFPACQIFFKHVRHRRGFARLNQKTGKMAARHRPTVCQFLCTFQRSGNMRFFQSLTNHFGAFVAARFLFLQKRTHCRMFNIDIEANNVNFVIFPDCRNFDAGYQIQRQSAAGNFGARRGNGICRIVIGYRQRADTHFNGAMNQGFGCQQAIRGLSMAV
ncbi:hypothetical protein EcWSU1_02515 [Enterobacter ludwigii]|uniref:Uncharacterized protein n=1 Tax=Enterobacter ludwigii TaxID=299767 RepID=G8LDT9_9ENTR|nr:hypothetical protein EcWSU1_02515 [Enterobacter ludwigii]